MEDKIGSSRIKIHEVVQRAAQVNDFFKKRSRRLEMPGLSAAELADQLFHLGFPAVNFNAFAVQKSARAFLRHAHAVTGSIKCPAVLRHAVLHQGDQDSE